MSRNILLIVFLLLLGTGCGLNNPGLSDLSQDVATVELDADNNGAVDIDKGGTNETTMVEIVPTADLTFDPVTGIFGVATTIPRIADMDTNVEFAAMFPLLSFGGAVSVTEQPNDPLAAELSTGDLIVASISGDMFYKSATGLYTFAGGYVVDPTIPTASDWAIDTTGLVLSATFSESVSIGANGQGTITLSCTNSGNHAITVDSGFPGASAVFAIGNGAVEASTTDTCALYHTQPGDGIEATDDGTDWASVGAPGASVINSSTEPSTYDMALTITDTSTTGDTFTVDGTAYDYLDSPVAVEGLSSASEAITYTGSNTATCTGTAVTGAGPWAVDMSDSAEDVACEVTESAVTYLINEDFSGTGTPSGWVLTDTSGAFNFDATTNPFSLSGQYLSIDSAANSISKKVSIPVTNYATSYGVALLKVRDLTTKIAPIEIRNSTIAMATLTIETSGKITIGTAGGTGVLTANVEVVVGEEYWFKWVFVTGTGSNATLTVSMSDDGVNWVQKGSSTNGTATADVAFININGTYSTASAYDVRTIKESNESF